ncbi:hypothetical protein AB0C27_28850 [Nonomuraea sp. NPDC048882]|uniref:hypothetical protein n=1 Tax=Nonomuraea sp. NPDC048882 TaxID=3154347 RepID=UPI0033DBE72D
MSPAVAVLLLLAGLSEAAGRLLPLLARRTGASRPGTSRLVALSSGIPRPRTSRPSTSGPSTSRPGALSSATLRPDTAGPGTSRPGAVLLLLTGAVVEGSVFALWPLTAWTLAGLTLPEPPATTTPLTWTPALAAPLLLAAVLAFPLLGPLLHLLLFAAVGAGLVAPLAALTDLGWWTAAGCVAVAGVGLGLAVEAVRRLVVWISATRGVPA